MALRPRRTPGLTLQGTFELRALVVGMEISDEFQLRIDVPESFPHDPPLVEEIGEKIPRTGGYHVNPDRSLCLGSPLRLRAIINRTPSLLAYVNDCLIPYLAAVSHKLKTGEEFLFGELKHGAEGELDDYASLFEVANRSQAHDVIRALARKRRIANKRPCPCRCGRRLGRCALHQRMLPFRRLASRRWFGQRLLNLNP